MSTPTIRTPATRVEPIRPSGPRPSGRARTLPTVDRLADDELRDLVEELADITRLELSRSGRRGRRALAKRTDEVVARAGRLGVDLDSDRPVVEQLDLQSALPVTRALAQKGTRMDPPPATAPGAAPRVGAAVNAGLRFLVESVTCGDETDPERLGRDDIALGGFTLAADGTSTFIAERFVGKFNDGDQVDFDPPLELANLSLRNVTFPATVGVILGLSEKDLGGFSKFLADSFDAAKGLIKIVFETVGAGLGIIVGAKIGALIGGKIGPQVGTAIGGPIGGLIGLLAGLVLGAIIGGIVALAGDDIFVTSTTTVSLDTPDASFADGSDSADVAISFAGFAGRYTVSGRWNLVR